MHYPQKIRGNAIIYDTSVYGCYEKFLRSLSDEEEKNALILFVLFPRQHFSPLPSLSWCYKSSLETLCWCSFRVKTVSQDSQEHLSDSIKEMSLCFLLFIECNCRKIIMGLFYPWLGDRSNALPKTHNTHSIVVLYALPNTWYLSLRCYYVVSCQNRGGKKRKKKNW